MTQMQQQVFNFNEKKNKVKSKCFVHFYHNIEKRINTFSSNLVRLIFQRKKKKSKSGKILKNCEMWQKKISTIVKQYTHAGRESCFLSKQNENSKNKM